ncbi:hypothetical protein DYI20_11635 [Auritidibacter ignavus]|nr:hypothetical protein DCC27_006910 [Auritidibacter sp. NML130574]NIH71858.1 transposase [Auritidibacter ignavus]PXA82500.1 hypothetical protein DCC26_00130 [Auritidibacter sp. NML120779]RMX21511.1 hypothetical protein DYI20_11635 [Auritidibacter ignavus]
MVTAYRDRDPKKGKQTMQHVINSLTSGISSVLGEVRQLAGTLKQRVGDILAYFDHPGSSNGPTEAINARLEHHRSSALRFRNPTNYITRNLLKAGRSRPHLHPQ